MPIKIGNNGNKNFKGGYVGVNGSNRKIVRILVGIGGSNKLVWKEYVAPPKPPEPPKPALATIKIALTGPNGNGVIPNTNVSIYRSSGAHIETKKTDYRGRTSFTVPAGKYDIKSQNGYKATGKTVVAGQTIFIEMSSKWG